METLFFSYHDIIEQRLQLYYSLMKSKQLFRDKYNMDPLSLVIVNNVNRFQKLEAFFLATTLLRYCDVKKINSQALLSGSSQIITQSKTKTEIELPPLFLTQMLPNELKFPSISLFTESYDTLRNSLKQAIPKYIREELNTQRTVTHIFRFLRASFMYLKHKDFYLASKYLGHKDPDSVASYVPPELINIYSHYLSKG